jgi:hypothetical protein
MDERSRFHAEQFLFSECDPGNAVVRNRMFLIFTSVTEPPITARRHISQLRICLCLTIVMLLSLLAVTVLLSPSFARDFGRATIDVPNYEFEREETQAAHWQISGPAYQNSFAYLILEPNQGGPERRALVLVDNIENPKTAYFLAGPKLLPVPEVKGKPLRERIDRPLSDSARLLDSSGTVTINVVGDSGQKEQFKFSFAPALTGFFDKFDEIPCLTLPDVLTFSRGTQTLEVVALLRNEKSPDFDPRCGKFTAGLVPATFSYVVAGRLRFAFTRKRFVILHKNYVVSIPYDLDDEAIRRSGFLVTKAKLQKILTDFDNFPKDPDTRPETADQQSRNETFAVQHRIDAALITALKAKGETR